MKGNHIVVRALLDQGVDMVFGYPGGAVLDIYDALYDYEDNISHILTSHEQGATHAADGYARSTGKTGVVIATSGPGATNLVTGIATAYMDSVPLVCITGNVAQHLIGKDSFQETYITGITLPITKHNIVVRDIKDLESSIRDAFRIANSDRKGPVLVDIPKDIMNMDYEFQNLGKYKVEKKPYNDLEKIKEMAKLINESKRPVLYTGGGITGSSATKELRELIDKSSIPTCSTIMGLGNLDTNDPKTLGMVGMHGRVSTNLAIENSDLLIAIGVRFSDRVALNPNHFAPNAKIIHVDIDPSEIGKNVKIDMDLIGDAKEVIIKLLPFIEEVDRSDWLETIDHYRESDYQPIDNDDSLKPHQLLTYVTENTKSSDILVTDVGQHQMWAAQYSGDRDPRTFLTSGGLGTMGFGFGAAMGASLANPDDKVIHITGDGSFHMNMNEIPTSVAYGGKVITIVFNNHSLGMPRQWQHHLYESRYAQSDFYRPTDYIKLADAFGAYGFRCSTIDEFKDAFDQALELDKTVVIECLIDEDEQVLPMIPAGGTVDDLILEG